MSAFHVRAKSAPPRIGPSNVSVTDGEPIATNLSIGVIQEAAKLDGGKGGTRPQAGSLTGLQGANSKHATKQNAAEKPNRHFQLFSGPRIYSSLYKDIRAFEEHVRALDYKFKIPVEQYTASLRSFKAYTEMFRVPKSFNNRACLQQYQECDRWLKIGEPTVSVPTQSQPRHSAKTLAATSSDRQQAPTLISTVSSRLASEVHLAAAPLQQQITAPPAGQSQVELAEDPDIYPNFVYIPGFATGAAQEDLPDSGTSEALTQLQKDAPPASFDIRALRSLDISVDELCAFFPLHYNWHAYLQRLRGAGYQPSLIARLIIQYRGYTEPKLVNDLRQRIQQALGKHRPKGKDYNQTHDFSTGAWELKIGVQKESKAKVKDWRVLDLARGLINLPLGANKRHLTLAIEHAEFWDETELLVSELPAYIREFKIGKDLPVMVATAGEHPDVAAREAFEDVVASHKAAGKATAKAEAAAAAATSRDGERS